MISTDLSNAADTLDAHTDGLAASECAGLAAMLRALADRVRHMEALPVPAERRAPPALFVVEGGKVEFVPKLRRV
jgi:hypothetical protein